MHRSMLPLFSGAAFWNVSNLSYASVVQSSNQINYFTNLDAFAINKDGTIFYFNDVDLNGAQNRSTMNLLNAFDITSLDIPSKIETVWSSNNLYGLQFDNIGSRYFHTSGQNIGTNFPYTLYDYTGAFDSSLTINTNLSAQVGTDAIDFNFSQDGTKLYVFDRTTNIIYQYNLSTAWDTTSIIYSGKFFNTGRSIGFLRNGRINSDGTILILLNDGYLDQYNLLTAYDISTASLVDSFSLASWDGASSERLYINELGNRFYVSLSVWLGSRIYQFNII